GELTPALAEEVADRYLDRGLLRAIPVSPQDEAAPVTGVRGQPDVRDERRSFDGGHLECAVRIDVDAGRDLPALAEVCRAGRAGALGGARTAPLGPVEVLRADRP